MIRAILWRPQIAIPGREFLLLLTLASRRIDIPLTEQQYRDLIATGLEELT
jgi:hypothetical protein